MHILRLVIYFILCLLFIPTAKAQTEQIFIDRANKNCTIYKQKVDVYEEQLKEIDSTYKVAEQLYWHNKLTYKKAKNAFKSLKINYKAELLPFQQMTKSKDRKEAAFARQMIQTIKKRFEQNGREAAQVANMASREMVRAQKIMNRANDRRKSIFPRYKENLKELSKWEDRLQELLEKTELD